MRFKIFRKNYDIVQIDETHFQVETGHQDVHEPLEGSPGIAEAERHSSEAIHPTRADEGSLVPVGGLHRDLMIR